MTKLLFRPGHEFLLDSFSVCEQRLKKLKNRLMSENLVEKYDLKNMSRIKLLKKYLLMKFPKNWSSSLPPTLTSTKGR